ncbi:dynein axonemal intermediate chain 4 [Helicoverpa armigera]|uniref:dynein axonemal intermediate chain 4 n=1 Tax=Helicoverpa armigera TaxID=29058 RepID=UPI002113734F|nr:dynein axonemal intermediate chain 4 [Helicoverpa armigera]
MVNTPTANQSQCILSDSTSCKTVKLAPQPLSKRLLYRVIVNGVDVTPDDINDPAFPTMEEMSTHAAYDIKARAKSEIGIRPSLTKSRTAVDGVSVYATTINLDDIKIDHTLDTEEGLEPEDSDLSIAPSAFYLTKVNELTSYPPEMKITLKETKTVVLFSIPCISYDKGTHEANAVEEENAYYEYITIGKGRNRKMVHQTTQTKEVIKQSRHTLATRPKNKNAIAFASLWDMHDTYEQIARTLEESKEEDEMVMYQSAAPHLLRQKRKKDRENEKPRSKTFLEIAQTPQYLDAVLLTERVLASLKYEPAQKKFRGLVNMDPLSLDLVYVYTLSALWTYECEETLNKPISSISFNPKYPHICAISHGKFAYADECQGMVCVWCFKNPCKPERLYTFDVSVTSVGFSTKNPNWLACGFSDGDVIILDIQSYTKKIIARSKRDTNPCFEPIWLITWVSIDRDNEYVMTTCQDGRIRRLQSTKTHEFISSPMMRICTVEGNLKGLETAKTCLKVDVPITRYPAVLCMIWHPTIDHCYLVGTDEGCIHRCSTHYLNQHMDVFRAHAGPVNDICVSPFMKNLLASCGADNAIRLWIEGLDDVIMTLNCQNAVNAISFCPTNSSILISVSGQALSVWDLRRKIHMPCAEYTFPGNVTLTYVQFEASGHNVFVGDTLGRLHTFHLEDTPIPPYNQTKMLDEAIRKALCTRPHMIKQLDKLMRFNKRKTKL